MLSVLICGLPVATLRRKLHFFSPEFYTHARAHTHTDASLFIDFPLMFFVLHLHLLIFKHIYIFVLLWMSVIFIIKLQFLTFSNMLQIMCNRHGVKKLLCPIMTHILLTQGKKVKYINISFRLAMGVFF